MLHTAHHTRTRKQDGRSAKAAETERRAVRRHGLERAFDAEFGQHVWQQLASARVDLMRRLAQGARELVGITQDIQ